MLKRVRIILSIIGLPWAASAQSLDVRLEVVGSALGDRSGMSNLFFTQDTSVDAPAAWDSTQAAVLTRLSGRDVRIARGWTAGRWEYRVDSDGDGAFADDSPLDFTTVGDFRASPVDVSVAAAAKHTLRFHILTAGDYVYGRPAQSWRGLLQVDGEEVLMSLRAASRAAPIPTTGADFGLFVDLNGDRELTERSIVKEDGVLQPSEAIRPDQPFRVAGRAYRIEAVDVGARVVRFSGATDSLAPVPGFRAPEIRTTSLDGRDMSLTALRGNAVIIEFWSTHCPFSERIRPEIRSLQQKHPNVRFIAIARETHPDTVKSHLADHPMAPEPWTNQPEIWRLWNPKPVTPLFYVIDRYGRVVAVEQGAGSAPVLEAWLKELEKKEAQRRSSKQ